MDQKPEGRYAALNGLNLYYEIHAPANPQGAAADPLILVHGGVGGIEMFGPVLPLLAHDRKVVAVELQAHGHTADIDRPLRYEQLADDIAALLKHLHINKADIMGYSLGGGVALRTAIQHPEVVRKLVVVAAPCRRSGWYPEILAGMAGLGPQAAEAMKPSPLYQHYSQVAPRPQDWPILITKLGEMLKRDYDWSKEVAALKMPILIVVGDADAVRTAHAVEFFELLGGGKKDAGWDGTARPAAQLAILPGQTHYNIAASTALATVVTPFLDGPAAKASNSTK